MDDKVKSLNDTKKVVIVGDGYSGKTTLLNVFCNDKRVEDYEPTIFDNYAKQVKFKGVEKYLALWDTSGQEEYEAIRKQSYFGTDIIIILFDISNRQSLFNATLIWEPEVRKYTSKDKPIVLVGNKSDLRLAGNKDHVSKEEAVNISRLVNAKFYREVSAITKDGVEEMFVEVVKILFKKDHLCRIL